jgi:hypothetical protein
LKCIRAGLALHAVSGDSEIPNFEPAASCSLVLSVASSECADRSTGLFEREPINARRSETGLDAALRIGTAFSCGASDHDALSTRNRLDTYLSRRGLAADAIHHVHKIVGGRELPQSSFEDFAKRNPGAAKIGVC